MGDIKNWLIGGGFMIAWGVTLGFLEWRASVHANEAIVGAGYASPAAVEANAESIRDLEKATEKMDDKVERIVQILLEE